MKSFMLTEFNSFLRFSATDICASFHSVKPFLSKVLFQVELKNGIALFIGDANAPIKKPEANVSAPVLLN